MTSNFGKGYLKDPQHKRVQPLYRSQRSLRSQQILPRGISLRQYELPIMDQGATSSCLGHGSAQAVVIASKVKLGFTPSPKGIYDNGRAVTRAGQDAPFLAPLADRGAFPADTMAGLRVYGVRPIGPNASDGRFSDIDSFNVNTEESVLQLEHAAPANGTYRIDETAPDFIQSVMNALSAGHPVCVGVFVDTAFQNYTGGAPIDGSPNYSDPNGGGHWLPITGYETLASGVTVFDGPNSWGRAWGAEGRFAFTSTWLLAAVSDCYPFTPREEPAQ